MRSGGIAAHHRPDNDRQHHRQAEGGTKNMEKAAGPDPQRRDHPGAWSLGGAAAGDEQHIGARGDVEEQPGRDKHGDDLRAIDRQGADLQCLGAQQPHGQLFLGHFQAEYRHGFFVPRRHVLGNI